MTSPNESLIKPKQETNPSKWIAALVIAIIASVLIVGIAVLSLNSGVRIGVPFRKEAITIQNATFESTSGEVLFQVENQAPTDVTITFVTVTGSNITPNTVVATNIVIQAWDSLTFKVTFPSISFQTGVTYFFYLYTSQGNKFPYSVVR